MSSTSDEVGHTATPWDVDGFCVGRDGCEIWSGDVDDKAFRVAQVQRNVDAAFIVRAVNSHDSLVKALERIASPKLREPKRSDYSSDDSYWEACGAWRMALIARAALSQAKGGK